jgi:RNA polymerase sigma-70 factor (ECF subfamily)
VWRQAGKFEGRSAVSTWLLAITRFKALSALRRRKEVELEEDAANAIEDTSDDPEVTATKRDTSEALRKCLKALSPEHQEIVDLVYSTRDPWKKWPKSSAFRRTLSRRACFMRAGNWPIC